MASRYDIALDKGPKKIVTLSFEAFSEKDAQDILTKIGQLNLSPLFPAPYTNTRVLDNKVQVSIEPSEEPYDSYDIAIDPLSLSSRPNAGIGRKAYNDLKR